MTDRRFPFAPLAAAMGATEPQAARELGLSGSTEQQYRRDGVTERVADRLAVKAGLHPWMVWPEMAEQAMADAQRSCEECGAGYWPRQRNQRFCSQPCSALWHKREHSRRRYRTDPVFAERKREMARAYYWDYLDYSRSQRRLRRDRQRREAA